MKPVLLAAAVSLLIAAAPPTPEPVRYRAILQQRQIIDLTTIDEGVDTTDRADTVYVRLAAYDTTGGRRIRMQLDSVAFHSADRTELPPELQQQLRGAISDFFLPADGSSIRQAVVRDGGGLSGAIYSTLLDAVPHLRGSLVRGATWSDSVETIQRGDEEYRHARYHTNYLVVEPTEVRAAFAASHARLSGTAEVSGTSTGTARWILAADRKPVSATRTETQSLSWKDDELPAPLPMTTINALTLTRLP